MTSLPSPDRRLASDPAPATFGAQVLDFYRTLPRPPIAAASLDWLDPYHAPETQRAMEAFYGRFYGDERPRLFALGINPGRFGAGLTGVPFMDGHALAQLCGIATGFPQRRELSATFVQRVVEAWGGADAFFGRVYITGVCPLGLLRGGKNVNYYDDPAVLAELEPFLVDALRRQIGFGARRDVAVVIGRGENLRVLRRLNAAHGLFAELRALEHPRFIMQYRRRAMDDYVAAYTGLFAEVLGR